MALVRKPGACAQYRYRDELFPSLLFRQAYDALCRCHLQRADQHSLCILQLAATQREVEVETALALLLEIQQEAEAAAKIVTMRCA